MFHQGETMKLVFGIALCSLFCLAAAPLHAQGILIVQSETSTGKTVTNQIQIDKNYLKVESGGSQAATVFDGPNQTMRVMDLAKKTYLEITKADLEQAKKQMDAVTAQFQNMTPAQRQQMEQLMQGRGMAGMAALVPTKPDFRAAGSDKVGSWTCTKYDGYVNNQKTVEVCAVNPSVLNLTAADFEVGKQMAEFVKSIQPEGMDRVILNATTQDQGYNGLAVRRTTFKNGAVVSVVEITQLKRETFPASTFAVPAGFTKTASPLARGAR
jgi:hypothetical protein